MGLKVKSVPITFSVPNTHLQYLSDSDTMATRSANGGSHEPVDVWTKNSNQPGHGDSDTQSLEERNERTLLENPNNVTSEAQPGVQKAEATALVWTRTALYTTYSW